MTGSNFTSSYRVIESKVAQKRHIKVQTAYYNAHIPDKPSQLVPKITLRGHWLAEAGFTIETPLVVRVMDGCLVFTINRDELDTELINTQKDTLIQGAIERDIDNAYENGFERGIDVGMEKGKEQGIEQGLERGLNLGIEKGRVNGFRDKIYELAKNMKDGGESTQKIAHYTHLSIEMIEAL